jgi:hypothetical protein
MEVAKVVLADANAPTFKDDLHDAHEDLYERPDWALLRSLPTLAQKAGCSLSELPAVLVKEVTDNALDAAGLAAPSSGCKTNGSFLRRAWGTASSCCTCKMDAVPAVHLVYEHTQQCRPALLPRNPAR